MAFVVGGRDDAFLGFNIVWGVRKSTHFSGNFKENHCDLNLKGIICCNLSPGFMTDARGCKVVGQEKDMGVTSHVPKNAKSVRE